MQAALALCRFAHFLSAMIAFGASAYVSLLAPIALRRPLWHSSRSLVLAAALVALVSAAFWVAMESAEMAGEWSGAWDPDTIEGVLFDTAFGRVWQVRLLLCAMLIGAVAVRSETLRGPRTGLAALVLASLGLTGHAVMQTGAIGALHRGADALHLLCAGAWIGGLAPFALCLRACASGELRGEAVTAMRRYSRYGHFFVGFVIVSGMTNVALTIGGPPFPLSSPYRALLATKMAIVASLAALALLNRYVIVARWGLSATALRALRTTSVIEIALGAVIVALVSVFGLLDPA
jgi:putative copper resistance protein D